MSSSSKLGIIRFLGTNCDRDVWQAAELTGWTPEWLWYEDQFDPKSYGALVVPGGFSYGDYLRSGALASKAPVIQSLIDADKQGLPILGICNGFQVLTEAGLLPGALVKNEGLRFIDRWISLKLENENSSWRTPGSEFSLPIAHGDGRYFISEEEQKSLEDQGQIWLRYGEKVNGSVAEIAGVMNFKKNICGLMPHPERAVAEWMGGTQGLSFFEREFHSDEMKGALSGQGA